MKIPQGLQLAIEKHQEKPTHQLISAKFKIAYKTAVRFHQAKRKVRNILQKHAKVKLREYFPAVVARHQSLLLKRLGGNSEHLQRQKVQNLALALQKIDMVVIQPGQTFSYWDLIGQPKVKDGYVDGMLLARGKVVEGVGGGLCQLSNLLYWLFLHAPFEIVERYHHSYDVFPDSGRVLPFGSGATVFYNYVDLVAKNVSELPIQLKLWLTDAHLKGQLLAPIHIPSKFKIWEENHCFVIWMDRFYRYNEIYQDVYEKGELLRTNFVTNNFAPVLYEVSRDSLEKDGYRVIEIDSMIRF